MRKSHWSACFPCSEPFSLAVEKAVVSCIRYPPFITYLTCSWLMRFDMSVNSFWANLPTLDLKELLIWAVLSFQMSRSQMNCAVNKTQKTNTNLNHTFVNILDNADIAISPYLWNAWLLTLDHPVSVWFCCTLAGVCSSSCHVNCSPNPVTRQPLNVGFSKQSPVCVCVYVCMYVCVCVQYLYIAFFANTFAIT